MRTAAEHAAAASELLMSVEQIRAQVREWSGDERIQRRASGSAESLGQTMEFGVELAKAHALAALALEWTG